MVQLYENTGVYLVRTDTIVPDTAEAAAKIKALTGADILKEEARKNTITYPILESHNQSGNMDHLKIRFDCMASHDITYVGIIQTARASGLTRFPIPYVMTNCHNSLAAVGGTINEDDHVFGHSAAKKYGGIYVPALQAVIHQYMREMMAGGGKMILGSDSHTRYGALGTLAIGEGGGELAKQLLEKTYDIDRPEVVGVYLTGQPNPGVGPMDVALAIIGAVFDRGYVKNKVMEFIGDGIRHLNVEFRNGIDVMTTETTCLSSVWMTDGKVKDYLTAHGRPDAFRALTPGDVAYYDGFITVDLSAVKPMIAMPFHPSNVYSIETLNANLDDIIDAVEKKAALQMENTKTPFRLKDKVRDGALYANQAIIAGCAGGTFDNIVDAADILAGHSVGNGSFYLSVYPASQPTYLALVENGAVAKLMATGTIVREAFCGPCFGAGDVPANNALSIRHATRNFPNREGSKPTNGQIASVALMDARSVAATAINGGKLTPATDLTVAYTKPAYFFKREVYDNRVYDGFDRAEPETALIFGPNITDWPEIPPLPDHLLLRATAVLHDPVTTTDELIPSGETSSYRSNPLGLAEFTLSRKDPGYVARAKLVKKADDARQNGAAPADVIPEIAAVFDTLNKRFNAAPGNTGIGSFVYAVKPGDGSAREQAASSQRVLGGCANIAKEYATKRYRSNLINWGMLPFLYEGNPPFGLLDFVFIPDVRKAVEAGQPELTAYVVTTANPIPFTLQLAEMTADERKIILAGCLINYYR